MRNLTVNHFEFWWMKNIFRAIQAYKMYGKALDYDFFRSVFILFYYFSSFHLSSSWRLTFYRLCSRKYSMKIEKENILWWELYIFHEKRKHRTKLNHSSLELGGPMWIPWTILYILSDERLLDVAIQLLRAKRAILFTKQKPFSGHQKLFDLESKLRILVSSQSRAPCHLKRVLVIGMKLDLFDYRLDFIHIWKNSKSGKLDPFVTSS